MNSQRMSIAEYRAMGNTSHKNADRAYTAYVSSAAGRNFENEILTACEYYKLSKKAVINKVNEPYIVLFKYEGGKFMGRHTAAAEPDFKGVLKGGRSIAFEAKTTSKSRIQKSVVTEEQGRWLQEQYEMGAVTLVCICIRDRFFSIPWVVWRDMKNIFGKKYLMPADIVQYEVPYRNGVMFLEYKNLPFEAIYELAGDACE